MCVENKIKAALLDLIVEYSGQETSITDLVNKYAEKLLPLCEQVYDQSTHKRYYLSGVLEDGSEHFLVSALSEERALKDAQSYLTGHWKFTKIIITTANGYFKKEVLRGE